MLEVQIALKSIGVCLILHNFERLSILVALTVNRTGPDHHLVSLMLFLALDEMLVLQVLLILMLIHHIFHLMALHMGVMHSLFVHLLLVSMLLLELHLELLLVSLLMTED